MQNSIGPAVSAPGLHRGSTNMYVHVRKDVGGRVSALTKPRLKRGLLVVERVACHARASGQRRVEGCANSRSAVRKGILTSSILASFSSAGASMEIAARATS